MNDLGKKILLEMQLLTNLIENSKEEQIREGLTTLLQENSTLTSSFDISYAELHVLQCIAENEWIYGIDIASKLGLTRGGVSKIITRLVNKNLITTYQEKEGQKKIFFRLTELGMKVNESHERLHKELQMKMEEAVSGYSQEEQSVILHFLRKITKIKKGE